MNFGEYVDREDFWIYFYNDYKISPYNIKDNDFQGILTSLQLGILNQKELLDLSEHIE